MVPLSDLRTVVSVTTADQGGAPTTLRCIVQKADQCTKADRRQQQLLTKSIKLTTGHRRPPTSLGAGAKAPTRSRRSEGMKQNCCIIMLLQNRLRECTKKIGSYSTGTTNITDTCLLSDCISRTAFSDSALLVISVVFS